MERARLHRNALATLGYWLEKKYDVTINLFTISFLPRETKETLRETMDFIKVSKPSLLSTALATPIPGTKLWEEGLKSGELKSGDWKECLKKSGQIGTNFSQKDIEDYKSVFPTELIFHGGKGLLTDKIIQCIKNPPLALHYANRLFKFIKYKVTEKVS